MSRRDRSQQQLMWHPQNHVLSSKPRNSDWSLPQAVKTLRSNVIVHNYSQIKRARGRLRKSRTQRRLNKSKIARTIRIGRVEILLEKGKRIQKTTTALTSIRLIKTRGITSESGNTKNQREIEIEKTDPKIGMEMEKIETIRTASQNNYAIHDKNKS